MPDDHQMFILLEDIIWSRSQLHAAVCRDTDDIGIIVGTDIHILDGMSDPFWQWGDFIDGIAIVQLHIIKYLIGGETHSHFFCDITVWVDYLIGSIAK